MKIIQLLCSIIIVFNLFYTNNLFAFPQYICLNPSFSANEACGWGNDDSGNNYPIVGSSQLCSNNGLEDARNVDVGNNTTLCDSNCAVNGEPITSCNYGSPY